MEDEVIKQNIKILILNLMKGLGVFRICRFLTRNSIRIIGYHYVSIDNEVDRFPSLFLTKSSFDKRLEYINKNFKVITLDEAVRQLEAGRVEKNQVVLTFDDGLYNFKEAACPLLRKYDNPATLYVVSKYVLSQIPVITMLIRDVVSLSKIKSINTPFLSLPTPFRLESDTDKGELLQWSFQYTNGLSNDEEKIDFIKSLAELLKVDFDLIMKKRYWHTVSANDARSLSQEGHDIQLHGHNHTDVLGALDEVENNISQCLGDVETITGKPAKDYCYPVGLWKKDVWPMLKSIGIRSAVTTLHGPNFTKTPLLALRRIMDGEDRSQLEFEFEMSFLKWMLRLPLNWRLLYEPSEKLVSYKVRNKGF